MKNNIKKVILGVVIFVISIFLIIVFLKNPSHNRNWEVGQESLPKIDINEGKIEISNFRDFIWKKDGSVDKRYKKENYNLKDIQSTDVIISHFSDFEGLAHIFISFGFTDGRHIVVSMETRREIGEEFSPVLGLFRNFEIIYVVGSERDIVGLRTNVREDRERVYIYPTIASPEKSKELFIKIAEDINRIYAQPKFYNTLLNNCTNVITRRVEEMSDLNFPLTYKAIAPGYFDEVMYDMEIIPLLGSFEETKKCHLVNNQLVDYMSSEFENQIRQACN